jgi:hypothetical protein
LANLVVFGVESLMIVFFFILNKIHEFFHCKKYDILDLILKQRACCVCDGSVKHPNHL